MEKTHRTVKQRPGAQGRPRLSRKRYAESVRFLKKIIVEATGKTEKDKGYEAAVTRGMRAVQALLDVYSRFDAAVERAEARQSPTAQESVESQPEAPAPETAEQKADRLLERFRSLGVKTNG